MKLTQDVAKKTKIANGDLAGIFYERMRDRRGSRQQIIIAMAAT